MKRDQRALVPVYLLSFLGLVSAFLLRPQWSADYIEPEDPRMSAIRVEHVEQPKIVGQAQGSLDGSYVVPGGTMYYGWVIWPSVEDPSLASTDDGLGPGVAHDRPDVQAALGNAAAHSGFQVLSTDLGTKASPCLMVQSDSGFLVIPGADNGC